MAVRKHRRPGAPVSPRKDELKISEKTRPVKAKDKSKKAQIVAQEIKIARLLANNDKKVRDKVLKRLNKWLTVRSQSSFVFTKSDFMSLWKGLFYCMWLSDKMLIQEELAETLSKLVHCLSSKDTIVLYTSCALRTLATEWFGIDQYRLDKFSMLVRRILRQTFVVCKNHSWNMEWVTEISQMFTHLFLHLKTTLGFHLHVTEIYLEELAKISNGNVPEDVVHEFVRPFAEYLITTDDERQMRHIMRHVFRYLILQSDIGLDYMDKFKAWKAAGFPCARIDDMEKIEVSDAEENFDDESEQFPETETQNEIEKPLDPRVGKVNVELPQIPFNAAKIAELLSTYKFHPSSIAKSRRQLSRLINEFTELSQGKMPLGVKRVRKPNRQKGDMDSRKAALRLIQFEKDLLSDKVNKKRKREKTGKVVCDQVSVNNSKNRDTNEPESKLTNTTAVAKAHLQDTDADTVPPKKRKKSDSTCDIPSTKSEITENKKKLKLKTAKKSKITKITSNQKSKKSVSDKNVESKKAIVREIQISDNTDQHTSSSPISNTKIPMKGINKSISDQHTSSSPISNKKMPLKGINKSISDQHTSSSPISNKKIPLKGTNKSVSDQYTSSSPISNTKIPMKGINKSISDQHTSSSPISNKKMPLKGINKSISDQHTSSSSISNKKIPLKGTNKSVSDQYTSSSPISNKKISLKGINKSTGKKGKKVKKKITHQKIPLKNEPSKQMKKKANSIISPMEKKKVIFGLSRNTAQHTSEYLQQVRKSPGIPFDANKKPLAGVLKMSPIPSPLNPFYKN